MIHFVTKVIHFVLKMIHFVLKMIHFVTKMIHFVLKLMVSCPGPHAEARNPAGLQVQLQECADASPRWDVVEHWARAVPGAATSAAEEDGGPARGDTADIPAETGRWEALAAAGNGEDGRGASPGRCVNVLLANLRTCELAAFRRGQPVSLLTAS